MSGVQEAEVRDLARSVDVEWMTGEVTDRIVAEVFGDRADDVAFRQVAHSSVGDNIEMILAVLGGDLAVEETSPVGGMLTFAQTAAELRLPAAAVERAYRVGQSTFWSRWFELARTHADAVDVPVADLIGQPSSQLFAYIDHILVGVLETYDASRSELLRTREHLRRSLLPQVLDGSLGEPGPEIDDALDYRLTAHHVCLLIDADGTTPPAAALDRFARAAGTTRRLVARHGARSWLAWLGRPEPFGPGEASRLCRALNDSGLVVAVGGPREGLGGFRAVREQALDAARVQPALGQAVVCAADVRLETLLLRDEEAARAFVHEELGPLASSNVRTRRLRETLLAWLASGSHVSAAATLRVHEHTVRNRIREVEQLLPEPIAQRRAELQVALRLQRVLGSDPSTIVRSSAS